MIVSCKQCHHDFHATKYRRVFCSRKCKDNYERKIDLKKLAWFAFQGREAKEMAEILGVSRPRISRVLREQGLHALWTANRYA